MNTLTIINNYFIIDQKKIFIYKVINGELVINKRLRMLWLFLSYNGIYNNLKYVPTMPYKPFNIDMESTSINQQGIVIFGSTHEIPINGCDISVNYYIEGNINNNSYISFYTRNNIGGHMDQYYLFLDKNFHLTRYKVLNKLCEFKCINIDSLVIHIDPPTDARVVIKIKSLVTDKDYRESIQNNIRPSSTCISRIIINRNYILRICKFRVMHNNHIEKKPCKHFDQLSSLIYNFFAKTSLIILYLPIKTLLKSSNDDIFWNQLSFETTNLISCYSENDEYWMTVPDLVPDNLKTNGDIKYYSGLKLNCTCNKLAKITYNIAIHICENNCKCGSKAIQPEITFLYKSWGIWHVHEHIDITNGQIIGPAIIKGDYNDKGMYIFEGQIILKYNAQNLSFFIRNLAGDGTFWLIEGAYTYNKKPAFSIEYLHID